MEIQKWKFALDKIREMPTNERTLFFLLGHAINEINVLNKLFYLSNQYDQADRWREHAHLTQGMVLARTLLGKLWEAWKLLGEGYYKAKIVAAYEDEINPQAKDALQALGKHFGRGSFINKVRNSFAFHYSVDEMDNVLSQTLNPDELISYMAETNGNTVHYFSEYAINVGVMNAISEDDPAAAMEKLMVESSRVVGLFNEAAQGIMIVAAERYLAGSDGAVALEAIDIGNLPAAEKLEVPYFFEFTSEDLGTS